MSAPGSHLKIKRAWLLWAAVILAALLVKPVQDRLDAAGRPTAMDPDLLYFSSPAALKSMALGYDSLLADLYWMRAIQYYGRRDEAARRPVRYKNLSALLDIVTSLDPMMLDVYRAGCIFLAEPDPVGAGQPQEAIRLLEKGISYHPEDWRLWLDKGFIYFWYLQDYQQAGRVWLEAAGLANSPAWMTNLAASSLSQGGAVETAKQLWQQQLESSTREDVRDNARNHLASIQVDEDLWTLEFFLAKYAEAHSVKASNLEDLVRAGFLKFVPSDPSGVPYEYDAATGDVRLSPGSKVHYMALSYDYRTDFIEGLAAWYASRKPG